MLRQKFEGTVTVKSNEVKGSKSFTWTEYILVEASGIRWKVRSPKDLGMELGKTYRIRAEVMVFGFLTSCKVISEVK